MNFTRLTSVFVSLTMLPLMFSCSTVLYVAPRQTECSEGAGIPCYLIRRNPEGNWVIHEKSINGLKYEQGFGYKIKVKRTASGTEMNGTESEYTVVEVLEKKDMTEAILPEDLQNKEWQLESMRIEQTTFTPTDVIPNISFKEDGSISGFAGCNRYFGGYVLAGRVISFSNIGATKMFCEDAMQLEDSFLKLLSGNRRALFRDRKLILTGDDGNQMIFRYK